MGRRLDALRHAGLAEEVGRIVIISPELWPEEARDAYDAACAAGNQDLQADLIEAQTGERPVFPWLGVGATCERLPPEVIEIRVRPGGMQ